MSINQLDCWNISSLGFELLVFWGNVQFTEYVQTENRIGTVATRLYATEASWGLRVQVLPTLPVHMDVPFMHYTPVDMPQYSLDFSSYEPMEPQV